MNIITHALTGWVAGQHMTRRIDEMAIITVASVIADIDAFGAVIDVIRGGEAEMFSLYHHKFGHCLVFCLFLLALIQMRWKKAGLTLCCAAVFHLHLLCDILGARGPDDYQWPIYYFYPFSDTGIVWRHQWEINAWPNIVFTIVLMCLFLKRCAVQKFSPLALLFPAADEKFVKTLRARFKCYDGATTDSDESGAA